MEKRNSKIVLFVSVFALLYWLVSLNFDIYQYAFVGAIYELLWLPMLFLLFTLPILSIFVILKQCGRESRLWFLCLGIQILTLTFRFLL